MTENEEDLSLQKDFHVKRAKIGATFELKNIFFELGSAILKEDSKKELICALNDQSSKMQ